MKKVRSITLGYIRPILWKQYPDLRTSTLVLRPSTLKSLTTLQTQIWTKKMILQDLYLIFNTSLLPFILKKACKTLLAANPEIIIGNPVYYVFAWFLIKNMHAFSCKYFTARKVLYHLNNFVPNRTTNSLIPRSLWQNFVQ